MPDVPRRVRTQAERDADGTTWRHTANTRPGYATYPTTPPGNPSWWRHDPGRGLSPVARVMAGLDGPPPVDGETCAKWCGFCHLGTSEPAVSVEQMADAFAESAASGGPVVLPSGVAVHAHPPRRRWWHRYTRRGL